MKKRGFKYRLNEHKTVEAIKINNKKPTTNKTGGVPSDGNKPASVSQTSKKRTKKVKKKRNIFLAILIIFFKFLVVLGCLGIIAGSTVAVMLSMYLVEATAGDDALLDLEQLDLAYTSIIYYRDINEDGQEVWHEYQRLDSPVENRVWVDLPDIDQNLIDAFVAIEDQTYWEHEGINYRRTIYAILNELSLAFTGSYLRGSQEGASTITQQLIKNITDDDDDEGTAGYLRKIREIFRAFTLENRFSKYTILEAYLNTISLTGNIGGVQAGANRYFNKYVGAEDSIENGTEPLTIAQCATIACITKNPTAYSPITNPEQHLARRDLVIWEMYNQGLITEQEYNEALAEPLSIYETIVDEDAATTSNNNYFVDTLINELLDDYEEQNGVTEAEALDWLYNGGLRIYATVDPTLQETMEDVFLRGEYWAEFPIEDWQPTDSYGNVILDANGEEPEPQTITTQAAGATVNYKGELVAIVGGLGQKTADRTLNRGSDITRSIGSTIKGITVYPLAIEYDIATYSSTRVDQPYTTDYVDESGNARGWPNNYSMTYTYAPMTVYEAVRHSINTVAVSFAALVGVDEMYSFLADTLEVDTLVDGVNGDRSLAPMALGSMAHGMSPYQVAASYMMHGNGGQFYSPHAYVSVEDAYGRIELQPDVNRVQAISEDTAYITNRLLREVMVSGTGVYMSADEAGMDSIGKTGTTNENKDIWFVGLTPYYSSAFWYGYDENEPMTRYVAGSTRHPGILAWQEIMNTEQADTEQYPVIDFPQSALENEDVVIARFCTVSGALAGASCPSHAGYYKDETVLGTCPVHTGAVTP